MRSKVKKLIGINKLTTEVVVKYLWMLFSTHKYTLKQDWLSYGQTIGLNETPTNSRDNIDFSEELQEHEDLWIAMYCCSINRLIPIMDENYATKICEKLEVQLKSGGMNPRYRVTSIRVQYKGWASEEDYLKIIAGVDMLLNMFPDSNFAKIRVGH